MLSFCLFVYFPSDGKAEWGGSPVCWWSGLYFCFVCCLDDASRTGSYWLLGDAGSCMQVVSSAWVLTICYSLGLFSGSVGSWCQWSHFKGSRLDLLNIGLWEHKLHLPPPSARVISLVSLAHRVLHSEAFTPAVQSRIPGPKGWCQYLHSRSVCRSHTGRGTQFNMAVEAGQVCRHRAQHCWISQCAFFKINHLFFKYL